MGFLVGYISQTLIIHKCIFMTQATDKIDRLKIIDKIDSSLSPYKGERRRERAIYFCEGTFIGYGQAFSLMLPFCHWSSIFRWPSTRTLILSHYNTSCSQKWYFVEIQGIEIEKRVCVTLLSKAWFCCPLKWWMSSVVGTGIKIHYIRTYLVSSQNPSLLVGISDFNNCHHSGLLFR